MTPEISTDVSSATSSEWNGYNNVGICAVALMAVLAHIKQLSLPKALLVMPLVMHDGTVKFMGNSLVRHRQIAALVAARADLFANFRQRYESSLVVTINAIQMLVASEHIHFDNAIRVNRSLEVNKNFGSRALKIEKASANLAALLESSEEELYLNMRVWL
ncbi:three component ABC system middle component [Massilia sp. GER05]|uniref:three component ABC system middle component n=1 Tax=Massilia sp. GER05 TaxID=3394605 RepID=UPI003F86C62A